MHREILDFLKMNDVEYKSGLGLKEISPIKIGGRATVVAYPDNQSKLICLVNFLDNIKIKHKIVGRMSNILFRDENYDGFVIRTDRINTLFIDGNVLMVSCGMALPCLSRILCDAGLSGIEGLSGIPGSVGGAIIGNAGAFGCEIGDRVLDVTCYDKTSKEIISMSSEQADFSYRHSMLKQDNLIVLSARLFLVESDSLSIKSEMDRCLKKRRQTQPTTLPSLGSSFKRPDESISASKLIDECGLKGYSVGGAQVSQKHAGFIVNTGDATAKDYINLMDYVKHRVFDKFNISLESEVEII